MAMYGTMAAGPVREARPARAGAIALAALALAAVAVAVATAGSRPALLQIVPAQSLYEVSSGGWRNARTERRAPARRFPDMVGTTAPPVQVVADARKPLPPRRRPG